MKKTVFTIMVCLGVATASMGQYCTMIDFEDIDTGTAIRDLTQYSYLFSIISGYELQVVEEGTEPLTLPNIVAFRANVNGNSNSMANWLPGDNAKSFGNASTNTDPGTEDLTFTFNPDIVVKSFSIDMFDYGDWFPIGGSNPRVVALTAYDSDDNMVSENQLGLTYGAANDVWNLWNVTGDGARNLSVNAPDIAYVELTFEDMDPGITFDNIEICYCEWVEETAWADGERYVEKGNWATYTPYLVSGSAMLYAGQTMEAGMVNFSSLGGLNIMITLNEGWRFADVEENVKIQNYDSVPSGKPRPGQFEHKFDADAEEATYTANGLPLANFYGIHVEVERLDCGE